MHGERIRELRDNLRLTQEDIAYRLEVTPKTVSTWERGSKINSDNLIKLAQILDTSADFLLGLTDDPRPSIAAHSDLSPREWAVVNSMRRGDLRETLLNLVTE